jgi:hypothetical protein
MYADVLTNFFHSALLAHAIFCSTDERCKLNGPYKKTKVMKSVNRMSMIVNMCLSEQYYNLFPTWIFTADGVS